METKYVITSKVVKEVGWLRKFLIRLGIVPLVVSALVLSCDNSEAMAQYKQPGNNQKGNHIERKYHLIHEIVMRGVVVVEKIASIENLEDIFMKIFSTRLFDGHMDNLGFKCVPNML